MNNDIEFNHFIIISIPKSISENMRIGKKHSERFGENLFLCKITGAQLSSIRFWSGSWNTLSLTGDSCEKFLNDINEAPEESILRFIGQEEYKFLQFRSCTLPNKVIVKKVHWNNRFCLKFPLDSDPLEH